MAYYCAQLDVSMHPTPSSSTSPPSPACVSYVWRTICVAYLLYALHTSCAQLDVSLCLGSSTGTHSFDLIETFNAPTQEGVYTLCVLLIRSITNNT